MSIDVEPYEGFVMPCGARFQRDDMVALHAESCGICAAALDGTSADFGAKS